MKIKNTIAGVLLLLMSAGLYAQVMPTELMLGHRHWYGQHSTYRQFVSSRLGVFITSSFMLMHNERNPSELMSQSYLMYELKHGFRVGLGTFYATAPKLKGSFQLQWYRVRDAYAIVVSPRIDIKPKPTADIMTMLELRPKIAKVWRLYVRVQTMFNYGKQMHLRSYQYLRLGAEIRRMQFGIGYNRDVYGPEFSADSNIGVFAKVNV